MDNTVALIETLNAALTNYDQESPHVLTFELLNLRGEEPQPLSAAAAERWEAVLQKNPADSFAAHHLAVIYHGHAYQLQAGSQDSQLQAVDYWQKGLEMWSRVIESNQFWEFLQTNWQDRVDKGKGDMLAERLLKVDLKSVRKRLPQYLLDVHAHLVQTTFEANPDLAGQHLNLIRSAPFTEEYRKRSTESLYKVTAGNTVAAYLGELRTRDALDAVTNYLKIDPDHPSALADVVKATEEHAKRLKADGKDFFSQKMCFQEGMQYSQRLEKAHQQTQDLFYADTIRSFQTAYAILLRDEGIRLANSSDLSNSVNYLFESIAPARIALKLEKGGQIARVIYVNVCDQAAFVATMGRQRIDQARSYLQTGINDCPDHPLLHARMAYIGASTGDKALFTKELAEAERCQKGNPDSAAAQLIADLNRDGMGIGTIPLINEAVAHLNNQNYGPAMQTLFKANDLDPGNGHVLALLALGYNNQGQRSEALTFLNQAKNAVRSRPDSHADGYINNLSKVL